LHMVKVHRKLSLITFMLISACHAEEDPTSTVQGLIQRVLPAGASEFFVVEWENRTEDFWELESKSLSGHVQVTLRGNNGVSIASALNHYLRYFARRQISWDGDNMLTLPSPLPAVPGKIGHKRTGKWSYYQNVCTVSYSSVWWDWARWERELDWMALSGINLPLAFTGQEYIYQKVLGRLGVSDVQIRQSFFSGPGFLAWYRMGNIRGIGHQQTEPLPQSWINSQFLLLQKILKRAKALGMMPVLSAFTGFVPKGLKDVYPNASIVSSECWDDAFNSTYCSNYRVATSDPLYLRIGKLYLETQQNLLGQEAVQGLHIYSADQYNEMAPPFEGTDLDGIAQSSRAQITAMRSADPKAIWLMQGWQFLNSDVDFWHAPQMKAYLGAVPDDALIILDLASDLKPLWRFTESYYGKPFIWCMLHNFGGNLGLSGRVPLVSNQPYLDYVNTTSTMVGIGITMEGINQNSVVYDLMLEHAWRNKTVEPADWIHSYSISRYGSDSSDVQRAWSGLLQTVYSAPAGYNESYTGCPNADKVAGPERASGTSHNSDRSGNPGWWNPHWWGVTKSLMELRPALRFENCGFMPTSLYYEPNELVTVLHSLLAVAEAGTSNLGGSTPATPLPSTLSYDVVDVCRQILSNIFLETHQSFVEAFMRQPSDRAAMHKDGDILLGLLDDMDTLLSTDGHFLLGQWVATARQWANVENNGVRAMNTLMGRIDDNGQALNTSTPSHESTNLTALYQYNAWNLVTLWGPGLGHQFGGPGNIHDYASKQWAGLTSAYYRPRWLMFIQELTSIADSGGDASEFNSTAFLLEKIFPFELQWQTTAQSYNFPEQAQGDPVQTAFHLLKKYELQFED